jgi:hypothetical protein
MRPKTYCPRVALLDDGQSPKKEDYVSLSYTIVRALQSWSNLVGTSTRLRAGRLEGSIPGRVPIFIIFGTAHPWYYYKTYTLVSWFSYELVCHRQPPIIIQIRGSIECVLYVKWRTAAEWYDNGVGWRALSSTEMSWEWNCPTGELNVCRSTLYKHNQ